MKDINLKLSDEDYLKIQWIAKRLQMSITETLRSLIPDVPIPVVKKIDENEVAKASPADLVSVQEAIDRDKLRILVKQLMEKGWAVTLAKEIKKQLLDNQGKGLSVSTYKRLSRWAHPYRFTEREQFVKPRAEEISELLFGHVIERVE